MGRFDVPSSGSRSESRPRPALASTLAALALGAATLVATAAQAGIIHPGLQAQLAPLGLNDKASAIFIMKDQVDLEALNTSLKLRGATRQERHYEVITQLQQTAERSQRAFLTELRARQSVGEVEGFTPYWISNLVVIRANRQTIEALASRADVEQAEVVFQPVLIQPLPSPGDLNGDGGPRAVPTPGVRAIHANQVWHELGIWGEGALIGGFDTGVDGNHNALKTRWRGFGGAVPWQQCWLDVLGTNTQSPSDGNGHGTHCMGTMTGLTATDSIGVSPASKWIATNPINQSVGSGFDSDVIAGYQWMSDPDGNAGTDEDMPDVCQNSWGINEGFGNGYTDCDTRWWAALDGVEAAGCVVIFAAGNEGPGGTSLRSPADRATTIYNCFAVGAVDATNTQNFPFPIASFSSRGPTGCNVSAERKIKPEVSAPGVDVYSSFPGGGYGFLSGTSMACPHVSGVVALMRSANPNIPVDDIKQILMDSARDEGTSGEDNTYGWGFIDAYEAVLAVAAGFGDISGVVTNASNGGTPISGATVTLVEINRTFGTNGVGQYSGSAQQGTYTATASHPSFAPQSVQVTLVENQLSTQNFSLVDTGAPVITNVRYPQIVLNANDPIPVTASITDLSVINLRQVFYRVDGGPWSSVNMTFVSGTDWKGDIPGQPIGAHVDFYIRARDVANNVALEPANAPLSYYTLVVVLGFIADDAETNQNWSFATGGDTGVGTWVRDDPWGTSYQGQQMEPADDHTTNPSHLCFFTKQGFQNGAAGSSDVDGGCVTLTTPTLDLTQAAEATLSYWRWYGHAGTTGGDKLEVQISSNNGSSWTNLETVTANSNSWTQKTFDLTGVITFNNQVKVRYRACDLDSESLVEGAVDDFSIVGVPVATAVEETPTSGNWLFVNTPNPAGAITEIRFRLADSGPATLKIYDAQGRQVRSLASGSMSAGEHGFSWDGRNDAGRRVASGMYLYRFETAGFSAERKLLLVQ